MNYENMWNSLTAKFKNNYNNSNELAWKHVYNGVLEMMKEIEDIEKAKEDKKYKSMVDIEVQKYLDKKVDVYILETDESWCAGDYHYAVVVVDSDEFWLNSFDTEIEAIEYCNKNNLKIK